MYCIRCGTELDGKPKFCLKCGQPVTQASQTLSQPSPAVDTTIPAEVPVSPKIRKRRTHRRWLTCSVVVLALILVGSAVIGGAYLWFGLHRTHQTAQIVPADTGALIIVRPSVLQLLQLRNLENLLDGGAILAVLPGLLEAGTEIRDSLSLDLGDLDIDPQKDMLPWIGGEIGLAIQYDQNDSSDTGGAHSGLSAPAERRLAAYRGPSLILTAATRNQKASDAFLGKLRRQLERQDIEFDQDLYHGITVHSIVSQGHMPLSYATFNHLVVVATDDHVLRNAIDLAQGRATRALVDLPDFKDTISKLPRNRLGSIFLDWSTMMNYLELEDLVEELPVGNLNGIQELGIAVSLVKEGLRFDYITRHDLHDLSSAQRAVLQEQPSRHELIRLAPEETVVFLSGRNLALNWEILEESDFWTSVSEVQREVLMSIDPNYTDRYQEYDIVKEIEHATGVDLIDDLLVKMSGDYAWILAEDPDNDWDKDLYLGFLAFIQVEDQPGVEQSLEDLIGAIAEDEEIDADLDHERVAGRDVWIVRGWDGAVLFGYGFLDDVLFVGTSEAMIDLVAIDAPNSPLVEVGLFETTIAQLPAKSRGYLYLDMQNSLELMSLTLGDSERERYKDLIEPYIESISAIGLATEQMDENGLSRGTLFINTTSK